MLNGTGLSTGSDVLLTYTDSGGTLHTVLLNPTAAAGDGTSATLVVPGYANGAFAVAGARRDRRCRNCRSCRR